MKKSKLYILGTIALCFSVSADSASSLPGSISDLVEKSAPAVVNITSRKEVPIQNSRRGGMLPPELERFFGNPRGFAVSYTHLTLPTIYSV